MAKHNDFGSRTPIISFVIGILIIVCTMTYLFLDNNQSGFVYWGFVFGIAFCNISLIGRQPDSIELAIGIIFFGPLLTAWVIWFLALHQNWNIAQLNLWLIIIMVFMVCLDIYQLNKNHLSNMPQKNSLTPHG